MAAPNIKTATTFYGKTAVYVVTTTPTNVVTNTAGSGKVFKINSLNIANVNGTASANITASLFRSNGEYPLALTVAIPANNSLELISSRIYLEEGDSIRLTGSANGDLTAIISYEEIS